jgi:hypothetical protein
VTDEPLWTKRDVAAFLQINVRSVERLRLPRVSLPITGKRPTVRYAPADVRAWVDAQSSARKGRKAG